MKLTQQQIDDFNREGWLFLPELFSQEEVSLLAREALTIYDTERPEVWREKSGAPRTAFAAHLYNEAFGLLGAHPRMIEPVEQIFGEKVYMHQYKINAKSAFTGDVWQWHQDYGTWKRDDGMLMFHGNLVHGSAGNITPYPRKIVYLTLNAVSNYIRKPTRPEYIAHRDFTPIKTVDDDALLRLARAHRQAAE